MTASRSSQTQRWDMQLVGRTWTWFWRDPFVPLIDLWRVVERKMIMMTQTTSCRSCCLMSWLDLVVDVVALIKLMMMMRMHGFHSSYRKMSRRHWFPLKDGRDVHCRWWSCRYDHLVWCAVALIYHFQCIELDTSSSFQRHLHRWLEF